MDNDKFKKVPSTALNFSDVSSVKFKFLSNDEDEASDDASVKGGTVNILGYSGGIIRDHWWWGNLVIDLEGMQFPAKSAYPVLKDHSTDQKIGFSEKPEIINNQLHINKVTLLDTEYANDFVDQSKQGFPFEASIYAKPTSIENIDDGESVMVNGFLFDGPGTIWRKSTFKEVSICTFGYDPNTSATAMSEGDIDLSSMLIDKNSKQNSSEEEKMDRTKFKQENPEEYKLMVDEITKAVSDELSSKFSDELGKKDLIIKDLTDKNTKLSTDGETLVTRIMDIEKKFAIQNEKNILIQARSIYSDKFSDSGLPDRIKDKVFNTVDYNKFVENDALITDKFSEAIDAELKFWADNIGTTSSVMGGVSSGTRELGKKNPNSFTDDDADKLAKDMLRTAGLLDEKYSK